MTSNKGMIHKDMDIHGILKTGWWRAYLDSELSAKMGNKFSSIKKCKKISSSTKMNKNQLNIKQTNIEENIMDVKSLTKALINFAWFDSISSITWNHEIYLSLLKIEKMGENSENACQKEKKNGSKRFVEIWILCLDIWGWNLKIGNYSGEKNFEDLNQNLWDHKEKKKKTKWGRKCASR